MNEQLPFNLTKMVEINGQSKDNQVIESSVHSDAEALKIEAFHQEASDELNGIPRQTGFDSELAQMVQPQVSQRARRHCNRKAAKHR